MNKRNLIAVATGGALIALLFGIWMRTPGTYTPAAAVFRIDKIEDIEEVIVAAGNAKPFAPDERTIHAMILPHHTLLPDQLAGYWGMLAAQHPSVIVIIGPAHGNQGRADAQTTHGTWTTPVGDVQTADGLVDVLVKSGVVSDEPASFENEHAIGTHVPYLAKLMPGTPIVPIIAQSSADDREARELVDVLQKILPDDALVIASIDFAHYLPTSIGLAHDEETIRMIEARDYTTMSRTGSDHFDAPYALAAFLQWTDLNGWKEHLVWHNDIGTLNGTPTIPGTTYLVYVAE